MPSKMDPTQFLDKVCPYFPPTLVPDPLNPKGMQVHMQNCIGTNCQIYESCQGDLSPRAEATRNLATLRGFIVNLKKADANTPYLSAILEAAEHKAVLLSMALQSVKVGS